MTKHETNGINRVLVTGAAGFLGRATVEQLRHEGRHPIPVDLTERTKVSGLVTCDLTDRNAVQALIAHERPDVVLHYAAYGFQGTGLLASAEHDTELAVDVNVNGLRNVLHACEANGVNRLVWSSSTTVYGPPQLYAAGEPLDEDALLAPFTMYGATKMIGERITGTAFATGRVTAVGLRLPLIYGPGRWYGGAQKSLMAFIDAVLDGEGGTYTFDDTPTDWMFVDDAVEAMFAVATAPEVTLPVYNTVGHVSSPFEMAKEIVYQTGADFTIRRKPNARPSILIDGRRFSEEFGIRSQINLREGVRRYIAHLRMKSQGAKV